MAIDTEALSRPLRADARRNRERVLKAARAVFSARGRDAHLEDVARRAKVGVGTVYRHFPTKEALLEALAREQFELITEWAREAQDAPDAWEALQALLWRGAELAGLRPRADGGRRRVQAERRPPERGPARAASTA